MVLVSDGDSWRVVECWNPMSHQGIPTVNLNLPRTRDTFGLKPASETVSAQTAAKYFAYESIRNGCFLAGLG